jgi:NTP pyrophosphatase (non-canonical NTP hydrolase)
MDFNEYQKKAALTAIYPQHTDKDALTYLMLGACGEDGEAAEKLKKYLRGDYPEIPKEALALELGDRLWYLSEQARILGYRLEDIAEMNIKKLASRKDRQKLKGDGDNR